MKLIFGKESTAFIAYGDADLASQEHHHGYLVTLFLWMEGLSLGVPKNNLS